MTPSTHHRFSLGRTVATPCALAALERNNQTPAEFLRYHQMGEWGNLGNDDNEVNDEAVAHEDDPDQRLRVLSVYALSDGTTMWIITERDRTVTTILLPEEY